jgi:hypothetical protein
MSFGEAGCDLPAVWYRYRRSSCSGIALSGHPFRGGVAWWGDGRGSGSGCVWEVHIMLGIVQLVWGRGEGIRRLFVPLGLWLAARYMVTRTPRSLSLSAACSLVDALYQ